MDTKKKAWIVFGAVYLLTLSVALNQFKVPPVMPILLETFKMSKTTGGWLMSVFTIGGVILAIPAAMILKKIGVKKTGIITLLSVLIGAILGAVSNSIPLLMIGRIIEGIALGLTAVLAPATIAMWFSSNERGLPMGLWGTFSGIAFFTILNLANPIVTLLTWRGVWWFGAGLAFVALIVWFLFGDAPKLAPTPQTNAGAPIKPESLGRAMLSPMSWVVALMFFLWAGMIIGYKTWVPTYLVESVKVSSSQANFLTSLMSIASIPVAILTGWLLDRVAQRKYIPAISFLLASLMVFWAFKITDVNIITIYLILFAVVLYPVSTTCFTLAPDTMKNPANAPMGIGIATLGQNLGMFVFPPLLGSAIDKGGYNAAVIPMIVAAAVGLVASLVVKTYRTTPKSAKNQKVAQEVVASN